jgi:hypothetical protein
VRRQDVDDTVAVVAGQRPAQVRCVLLECLRREQLHRGGGARADRDRLASADQGSQRARLDLVVGVGLRAGAYDTLATEPLGLESVHHLVRQDVRRGSRRAEDHGAPQRPGLDARRRGE